MNTEIFLVSLVILTIMHYVGDFITPHRQIDTTSWKTILLSEWVLVLNPLHALWDRYSPWRRHPDYLLQGFVLNVDASNMLVGHNKSMSRFDNPDNVTVILKRDFWIWLGIDQLYHMLTNIIVAFLLGVLLW